MVGTAGPNLKIVILRSIDESNAVVRLHSNGVIAGGRETGLFHSSVIDPRSSDPLPAETDMVLYHYHDQPAIRRLKADPPGEGVLIGAFGADLYTAAEYRELSAFTDFFLMPTALHAKILASLLFRPVFFLGEAVDPAAAAGGENMIAKRRADDLGVLWFGYPESFYKSMDTTLPVLLKAREEKLIAHIAIVSDNQKLPSVAGITVLPFESATFATLAARSHYAILSHIPGDLHVNTQVKSPNKAITSIMAGLVPIASATPNYEQLFRELDIDQMLFGSPAQLYDRLQSADYGRDHAYVFRPQVISGIERLCSTGTMAQRLVDAVAVVRKGRNPVSGLAALETPSADAPKSRFAGTRSLVRRAAAAFG